MKHLLLLSTILILLFSSSCKTEEEEKESNMLPPLEVEIPSELKGNKEAEKIIVDGTNLVNQASESFEELAIEAEPYIGKTEDELGFSDKISLAKIGLTFMTNLGEFTMKMGELEADADRISEGMTEEEIKAMEVVHETLKKRMDELGEKYKHFADKNKGNK